MYKDHTAFTPPKNPDQSIWRYTDLARFLDLIQTKTLFFPRSDQFDDPFEGSITKLTKINRQLVADMFQKRGTPNAENLPQTLQNGLIQARKETYISCWHMNDVESQAMWSVYAREASSIAIQSTYARFKESLKNEKTDVYMGVVRYIDYDTGLIHEHNHFLPFLHKRRSYMHENELRGIVWIPADQQGPFGIFKDFFTNGIRVQTDIDTLVERIYVSPVAPMWFVDIVRRSITDAGYELEILQSRLGEEPIF